MKINKYEPTPKMVSCGLLRELYASENLGIYHVIVEGETEKHKHRRMEEVYYVEKGEGEVVIEEERIKVKEGDLIHIPKDAWHYLKVEKGKMEILVITHPKFDESDVIVY